MWENAFYIGGSDDGVVEAAGVLGVHAHADRAAPAGPGRRRDRRLELVEHPELAPARRHRTDGAEEPRARAPSAGGLRPLRRGAGRAGGDVRTHLLPHAGHAGVRYSGRLEGGALIADANGRVLAARGADEGPGIVVADIEIGRTTPMEQVPERFWLHRRHVLSAFSAVWSIPAGAGTSAA